MKSPTQKQIEYAEVIAKELEIDFPTCSKDFTRSNYFKFISKYRNQYLEAKNDVIEEDDIYEYYSENDVWCEYY